MSSENPNPSGHDTLLAGVTVFGILVAGLLYLQTIHENVEWLLVLGSPAVTALLVNRQIAHNQRSTQASQEEHLSLLRTVKANTNGDTIERRVAAGMAAGSPAPSPAGEPPSTSTMPPDFLTDTESGTP